MKKTFIKLSIGFCLIGCLTITIAPFILSTAGSIISYSGIALGLIGVGCGAIASKCEKKEYQNIHITDNIECSDYVSNNKANELNKVDFSQDKTNFKDNELTK